MEDLAHDLVSRDQVDFNYRPHVTLATFGDAVKPETVPPQLDRLTRSWKPLPVSFDGFLGKPPTSLADVLISVSLAQ